MNLESLVPWLDWGTSFLLAVILVVADLGNPSRSQLMTKKLKLLAAHLDVYLSIKCVLVS
jgi:hypothetical protein